MPVSDSDTAFRLGPLFAAFAVLALRFVVLAGEAALNGLGLDAARALGAGTRSGRALVRLKDDPERAAATVRTALALTVAVTTALLSSVAFGLLVPGLATPGQAVLAGALATWLVTAVTDPLPRSLASSRPDRWAMRTALPVDLLRALLEPVASLVALVGRALLKPFDATLRFTLPPPPLEELERLLTEHPPEEGAPEPALVRSLFEFGDRTVEQVMVPRTDVLAIPLEATPQQVVDLLVEEGHTRVPVFRGTLDTIVGIVHVKDVLPLLANPELIILHDLLRPCPFVPWNRPVAKVMRELQRSGQHFAVVVDEYGGVAGIITLEDIVEQIVGDIRDEFDEEAPQMAPAADGTSLIPGDLRVAEFNRTFDADVPVDQGFETMGGYLSALAGALPAEGDRFYQGGLELLVLRRDPRRVLEIRVTRTRAGESTPPDGRL